MMVAGQGDHVNGSELKLNKIQVLSCTSHILGVQWPHVTSDYFTEWCNISITKRVLLDGIALESGLVLQMSC